MRRVSIEHYILRLRQRIRVGELSKTKALMILRGKTASIRRKKRVAIRDDLLLAKAKKAFQ